MSYRLKIGLLGDPATGKTSLGKRYTDDSFSMEYKATVGVDIYFKEVENEIIPIQEN